MKHNFSRELACFNLAQQIIEDIEALELTAELGAYNVSHEKIAAAFVKYWGKQLDDEARLSIISLIGVCGGALRRDCGTFEFAHGLYHVLED